jgi:hypothetical protein
MTMISPPSVPLNITYVDPDGNNWDLSDITMTQGFCCSSITGIEGLPVTLQLIPLLDGTSLPNIYIPQPGTITLAIIVGWPLGGSETDYYELLDALMHAFINRRNNVPAPGYLQIQRPDGTVRQVTVYAIAGHNTPDIGIYNTVYTLTLQTPDPYWYELQSNNLLYTNNPATGILPLLPIAFSGPLLGAANIYNSGNAPSYPVWTITGPGIPLLQNLTTGLSWTLTTAIPTGQVIQVGTVPGNQYAVNTTTGENIWDQLSLSTLNDLWPLVSGMNELSIATSGSSSATSIGIEWTQRWNRG